MTTTSRPAGAVPEQGAPPSVGSSMPPEPACEMARAGGRLDLGDRVGARRIVRRVLDRAALELLAGLADLATDLGLGEEDLGTAAVRRALRWVPPRGWAAPDPGAGPRRAGGPAQHLAAGHAVRAARRLPRRLRPRRLGAPAGGGVHGLPSGAHPGRRRPRRRGVRGLPGRRARPSPDGGAVRGHPGRGGAPPTVGPPRAAAAVGRRRRRRPGHHHRLGRRPGRPHPPGPARPLTRASRAPGPVT